MIIGKGLERGCLPIGEVAVILRQGLEALDLDGKRVLVLIPDGTRSMPLPLVCSQLYAALKKRVKQLDYLVALGTHPPLDDQQLSRLVGREELQGRCGDSRIFNHEWEKAETFTRIGVIPRAEIASITGGLLRQDVPVEVNKLIFDYDQLIICGPVFPHEVAGFSGGNKYFFPGIAGAEIIDFTHWLGALITSSTIIGTPQTPVRTVIDRAASLIDVPTACFAFVVTPTGIAGLYCGSTREAWAEAAQLSAIRHILYVDHPYRRVLSVMPQRYTDLWTAAKGMYKLEPVVADGGEVIIYAPHVRDVSYTHGRIIDELGYHCRDYFLSQWERFGQYPGGVLAHSTHVKGLGTFNPLSGVEQARIQVTLATGIPEERCRRINLGYMDPASIDPHAWQGREAEGILVAPDAGEMLYRLKEQVRA